MLPISLNVEALKILLIGQGEKLLAREKKLRDAGAKHLKTINYQPSTINFKEFDVVMIVDLPEEICASLHAAAKAANCLVNVEDNKKFCDFFFHSAFHRGALTIGVSTGGQSPATARIIREKLEEIFDESWAEKLKEIANLRKKWKSEGASYDEVNKKTSAHIKQKGWL